MLLRDCRMRLRSEVRGGDVDEGSELGFGSFGVKVYGWRMAWQALLGVLGSEREDGYPQTCFKIWGLLICMMKTDSYYPSEPSCR